MTYTFSNGTTADATQVNQNFTDIINSLTDTTKSLSIDALTAAGTAAFNGSVTLGNGTPDDITVSGSLASSIPIKTNNSFDFGSSTLGLASLYLGSPSSRTTRLRSHQSLSASYTFILPNGGGTDGYYMQTDGSGNTSWQPVGGPELASNYSLSTSVASSAMTIALKDATGSDPSTSSPVRINFRSSTAATGTVTQRSVTAALSVTITAGATLGHRDGIDGYIYVYAIDNAGTVELAVSGQRIFDNGKRQSTTAFTTGADSSDVLYSTTNRSNVAIRFLGRIQSNQATAGTYSTNASEVAAQTLLPPIISDWVLYTLSLTGATSNPTKGTVVRDKAYWRRVGDTMEIRYEYQQSAAGSTGSGTYKFGLPSGYTIDTNKVTVSTTNIGVCLGPCHIFSSASGTAVYGAVEAYDTSNLMLVTGTGGTPVSSTSFDLGAATVYYSFEARVPISGWSSDR